MRSAWALALFCGLLALVVRTPAEGGAALTTTSEGEEGIVQVSLESGRLTLRAHEAPLGKVLEAVGSAAGVTMVVPDGLDVSVTETLVDIPLEEGIRRLSRGHSVVLIYGAPVDSGTDIRLTEVWFAGASGGSGEAERRPPGDLRADTPKPVTRDRTVKSDFTAAPRELVDELSNSDPLIRRDAVLALVRGYGLSDSTVDILRGLATADGSPVVRRAALFGLTSQPGMYSVEQLRSTAIQDPDPSVRRVAIFALASTRSAEAGDILLGIQQDPNPDIRAAAERALARWRRQVR